MAESQDSQDKKRIAFEATVALDDEVRAIARAIGSPAASIYRDLLHAALEARRRQLSMELARRG